MSGQRPYAGQTWAPGVLTDNNLLPGAALQIVARDLAADAREHHVQSGDIELWQHTDGRKGFFVGDTSSLEVDGWVKVATL